MKRPQPTRDEVLAAMEHVLAAAAAAGRTPTVAAVERRLGVTHATFYRNHRELIRHHFQPRAARTPSPGADQPATSDGLSHRRLRAEIDDLRRTLVLYEEAIRQLSVDNDHLRSQLTDDSNTVRSLRSLPS